MRGLRLPSFGAAVVMIGLALVAIAIANNNQTVAGWVSKKS